MARHVIPALGLMLSLVLVAPVQPQDNGETAEELKAAVQMPIATAKAARHGQSPEDVKELARSLREANLPPRDFNAVMQKGVEMDENSRREMGRYVKQKRDEGLRGKELAQSIHAKLRSQGIPAGKKNVSPLDEDFVPPGLRKDKQRGRRSDRVRGNNEKNRSRGRSGRDRDEREHVEEHDQDAREQAEQRADDVREEAEEREEEAREREQERREDARERDEDARDDAEERRDERREEDEDQRNAEREEAQEDRDRERENRGKGRSNR